MSTKLPKYIKTKMKGNIGEAFAQYILSNFCLVHKIDGSNDIGNDFICELIKEEYPTNLLFYVQVKYTSEAPTIDNKTKQYWKISPIPVYVFWIKDTGDAKDVVDELSGDHFDRYTKYKRFTPISHSPRKHINERYKDFREMEFKRDVLIDYARSLYNRGITPVIKPRDFLSMDDKLEIGLGKNVLFMDLIYEYLPQIKKHSWGSLISLAYVLKSQRKSQEDIKNLIKIAKEMVPRKEQPLLMSILTKHFEGYI